jgi:hypothetical protein
MFWVSANRWSESDPIVHRRRVRGEQGRPTSTPEMPVRSIQETERKYWNTQFHSNGMGILIDFPILPLSEWSSRRGMRANLASLEILQLEIESICHWLYCC